MSMEPNVRWHFEVLLWLSRSDVCKLLLFTQHVTVVLPVELFEKLCFIVPSFEAGKILLSNMCFHFFLCNGTSEMVFVQLVVGYMYIYTHNLKILVVGNKVSLPIVKCLCHFVVYPGFKGLCLNIHFFT